MGTTFTVRFRTAIPAGEVKEAIFQKLTRVNGIFSTYDQNSEISRLNRSSGPFKASSELGFVLDKALDVAQQSGGAFDPTLGPLVHFWGFSGSPPPTKWPSKEQISQIRDSVTYKSVTVNRADNGYTITKSKPGVTLDLSSIAKGYAVDVLADYLRSLNIVDYYVEVGGEMRLSGQSSNKSKWAIGINRPQASASPEDSIVTLKITNTSLATSGTYRNFYELGQQSYSHLLDGRTGFPVQHRLVSVTIIGPDCMISDALATAALVLGPIAGAQFLTKHYPEYAYYFMIDQVENLQLQPGPTWPAN